MCHHHQRPKTVRIPGLAHGPLEPEAKLTCSSIHMEPMSGSFQWHTDDYPSGGNVSGSWCPRLSYSLFPTLTPYLSTNVLSLPLVLLENTMMVRSLAVMSHKDAKFGSGEKRNQIAMFWYLIRIENMGQKLPGSRFHLNKRKNIPAANRLYRLSTELYQ